MSWTHDDGDAPWVGFDAGPVRTPEQIAAENRRWEMEQTVFELLRDAGLAVRACRVTYPDPGECHADGVEHPALDAVFATPCCDMHRKAGAELFYGESAPWWAADAIFRPEFIAVVLEDGEIQTYWRHKNVSGETVEIAPCANFE